MSDNLRPAITVSDFSESAAQGHVNKLQEISEAFSPDQPIIVTIDSHGGSIYGLSLLYSYLESQQHPIITYTASKAFSAGAILLAAGASKSQNKSSPMRVAAPNATIMIHELQAGADFGDIKSLENAIDYFGFENDRWMGILAKAMGRKTASDVRKLLHTKAKNELYLTARQALRLKLIDAVGYLRMSEPRTFCDPILHREK